MNTLNRFVVFSALMVFCFTGIGCTVIAPSDVLSKYTLASQTSSPTGSKGPSAGIVQKKGGNSSTIGSTDDDPSGSAPSTATRFTKDSSGIITDSKTGLQWFCGSDFVGITFSGGQKWAKGLAGGNQGWRLPTLDELKGLSKEAWSSGLFNIYTVWSTTPDSSVNHWNYCYNLWYGDVRSQDAEHGTCKDILAVRSKR